MPTASRPLRLLITVVLALALAALLWALFGVLRSGLELWRELRAEPLWLQVLIGLLIAAALAGLGWGAWRLLRRPRHQPARSARRHRRAAA
jgi:hypothetical protein